MIKAIEATSFKKNTAIQHGFFTRQGGVSQGCYGSLNCCYMSQDNPIHVEENRRRAMAYLRKPLGSLVSTKNVHGNQVVIVEEPWVEEDKPEADAMVTRLRGIVLGSDSADCPIILLADEESGVIGLTHAGWRSVEASIIERTVKKMISIGANANHIIAVIGPCIAQNSYEVDLLYYQKFLAETQHNQIYFKPSQKQNHFLFDLRAYVKDKLIQSGLKNISAIEVDTYEDEEQFFSCRRSLHKGEPDFGGHLTVISLL